ncbi:MAG: hydantoinase/oxoprolinase family protein [Gemmatimonadetes bacterium]|nr:hydantoinase/oxoprolinase family protein [Gemmatimonadota bacterium]MYH19355.1 hydantoinase/oxoprolinase family protein [Gemmatimonadota bacterium]MYK99811.1 hydantoinase/oxoprolinase family protein [Gemmatimonadota bacterium]
MNVRIAIDTGGTFTDLVLSDPETGRLAFHKVPSTPADPSRALVEGVRELVVRAGYDNADILFLIHGTTVATNTILQRKGARTAFITTEGFRDVLHIQRQDRPHLYNMRIRRTPPLVPRSLRYELPERTLHDGSEALPVDRDRLEELIEALRVDGIEAVGVGLLHSHIDPSHERAVGDALRQALPETTVCLSSDMSREEGEYERFSTCAMNAYVQPVMTNYLKRVNDALSDAAVEAPLFVMKSNGGVTSARDAADHCVHTILSGPAGGVVAGDEIGRRLGRPNVITADMGGTSFDVAMIHEGTIAFAKNAEIDGLALKAPMMDIHTIGAGGGSIAWIDSGGALRVGPQSAGAVPGPACYRTGGNEPTVTDANLVLGRLSTASLLGGAITLDPAAAQRVIEEKIAAHLGCTVEEAAEGIIRVINASMTAAIRKLTVERGYDPRLFTLVPFGGAGPLHGAELARELGIRDVVIPLAPGVASAEGLVFSNLRTDRIQTHVELLDRIETERFEEMLVELTAQATEDLATSSEGSDPVISRRVGLRYAGQGYDIPIDLPGGAVDLALLGSAFHLEHERQYGFARRDQRVQLVNVWVSAELPISDDRRKPAERVEPDRAAPLAARPVYFLGDWADTPVYGRTGLLPGQRIDGPAIVEQLDSTTLIGPGQTACVDEWEQITITGLDSE